MCTSNFAHAQFITFFVSPCINRVYNVLLLVARHFLMSRPVFYAEMGKGLLGSAKCGVGMFDR